MVSSIYDVIVEPLVTEKSNISVSQDKYTFKVNPDSNKISVKTAVEKIYGVKVASVNISNVKGKKVRYGKYAGRKSDWKKAVVTLKKGEKIEEFVG